MTAWRSAVVEVERAAKRGDSDKALRIASAKGYPLYQANARDTARFRELQEGVLEARQADTASALRVGWWADLGALGMAVVAGLVTLFFVRRTSHIAQGIADRAVSPVEAATPALGAGAAMETAAQVGQTAPAMEAATPAVEAREESGQVDEIAFRMSLLSLNAALEAAGVGSAATGRPAAAEQDPDLVRRSAPPAEDGRPGTRSAD
jgi:hypothetical protein